MGALIRAVAHSLPLNCIRLDALVMRIVLTPSGAELATDDGGRIGARQVVLAVPPRLLEETVHFSPMLDAATAELWHGTPTWMVPHAKFFALYDRPFWREVGLSGAVRSTVGPLTGIHDATTASGQAPLFGFVPSRVGGKAINAATIAQLRRLFGTRSASPITTLFKDWAADPLTATKIDFAGDEHSYPDHRLWVNGYWRTRLVLAASETSRLKPSYLAGAFEAAQRAAAEVVLLLGKALLDRITHTIATSLKQEMIPSASSSVRSYHEIPHFYTGQI
jgi:monoamine oxidase